tara:strand:- start:389 stop:538 length:150 start_codon:yes stop_codon:yes gene_type:complete
MPIIKIIIFAHIGFLKPIAQYIRNIILMIYSIGKISPINEIGQKKSGLM